MRRPQSIEVFLSVSRRKKLKSTNACTHHAQTLPFPSLVAVASLQHSAAIGAKIAASKHLKFNVA